MPCEHTQAIAIALNLLCSSHARLQQTVGYNIYVCRTVNGTALAQDRAMDMHNCQMQQRTAPHRTAPHRTAPHGTAWHGTAVTAWHGMA